MTKKIYFNNAEQDMMYNLIMNDEDFQDTYKVFPSSLTMHEAVIEVVQYIFNSEFNPYLDKKYLDISWKSWNDKIYNMDDIWEIFKTNLKEDSEKFDKDKMYAVLCGKDEIVEIDTSFLFDDQYNTVANEGNKSERIYDSKIKKLINDKRSSTYKCSVKQGTYEECLEAINKKRSLINKCGNYCEEHCSWYGIQDRDATKCNKREYMNSQGQYIKEETTVYNLGCNYKKKYGNKCVHDIAETPTLMAKSNSFFNKYPDGIPDNQDIINFMLCNHEKYNISTYWSGDEFNEADSFRFAKTFGSYKFEFRKVGYSWFQPRFELSNARNSFYFSYDIETGNFIYSDCRTPISWNINDKFITREWSHKLNESVDMVIKNFDKFIKWWNQIIEDYKKESELL